MKQEYALHILKCIGRPATTKEVTQGRFKPAYWEVVE